MAAFLAETGFPAPILADSGNGAHLLYSIDLPNDDASRLLIKRCLEVLDILFSDDKTTIDTANFNTARIWKLYGTMSRKGDHTPERLHRKSRIMSVPDSVAVVAVEQLHDLCGLLPAEEQLLAAFPVEIKGYKNITNLSDWLNGRGITVKFQKPYAGGTLFILDQCPFSTAHKDGAYAIQFPSGAIHAGCHHDTCGGGKQRWQELRERFEPKGMRKKDACQKEYPKAIPPRLPPGPLPSPAMADVPGRAEALEILQHGDPLKVMLETFLLDHEGDKTVAECLILSLASRAVLNTTGLHVSVSGESGKGKSHAFSTLIRQVPERFQLAGSMSNKALFYIDNLQPGMVIVLDDTSLSEDMSEILKGVTTSFKQPFVYRTVNKDRKGFVCTIPERCVWWVAKVEGSGDDQVFNRMLTCWIDDSVEQDDRVLARILEDNETLPGPGDGERPEVLLCRAIWELLGSERKHVVIPFAKRIRFQTQTNRRNPEMLLGLIKAHALLYSLQRPRVEGHGVPVIRATREDFDAAVRLYSMLNGTNGGQTTKLTKMETDLIGTITTQHWTEFTIPMLQKSTSLSNGVLHRLIHGYTSRGAEYTGLLEKCPAIAYTDRTVVSEDEKTGFYTRRRTNAYTFDREMFQKWMAGGAVWLDDDPGHDPDDLTESRSSPSNTMEVSVRSKNADSLTESRLPNKNTSFNVLNSESHSNSDLTRGDDSACVSGPACIGDPEISVRSKTKIVQEPQISELNDPEPPITSRKHVQDAVGQGVSAVGHDMHEDVENPTERRIIHATDYKPLDIPVSHVPCYCCGKKGSWYVEKLTTERRARPKDKQIARRVCRKCYDAAVYRDRASAPPLPGMIDLFGMERHYPNIGKCSVCDLGSATYLNEKTGVKLCEACHAREVHRQCSPEGVTA